MEAGVNSDSAWPVWIGSGGVVVILAERCVILSIGPRCLSGAMWLSSLWRWSRGRLWLAFD